tara:strand:+ start:105 stop:494 length:390 start_codon:yes stop_codon:yes gene_type:complete
MPRVYITWQWEEAFDKFGFGDGDGWNGTHEVEGELESLGYEVETDSWGCHNYMIMDIKKDGKSILFKDIENRSLEDWLPEVEQRIKDRGATREDVEPLGYEPARNFLPQDIIDHLDKVFNEEWEDDYYA